MIQGSLMTCGGSVQRSMTKAEMLKDRLACFPHGPAPLLPICLGHTFARPVTLEQAIHLHSCCPLACHQLPCAQRTNTKQTQWALSSNLLFLRSKYVKLLST